MYDLGKVRFEDIFAGPPPQFAETYKKKPVGKNNTATMNKNKKGQFTLDGWIRDEKAAVQAATHNKSAAAPTKGNFGQIGGGEQAVPSSPVLTKPLSRTVVRVCRAGWGEEEQK